MKIEIEHRWTETEIEEVIMLYKNDASLVELTEELDRPVIDILILIEHLIIAEKIECNRLLVLNPKAKNDEVRHKVFACWKCNSYARSFTDGMCEECYEKTMILKQRRRR